MDNDDRDAFRINGTATLQANCGVYVNSDHPTSAGNQGGDTCLKVPEMGLVGGMNMNGNSQNCTPEYVEEMAYKLDPLAHMYPPSTVGLANYGDVMVTKNDVVTLDPGVYTDIRIMGGEVTLNPGLYVIDGGNLTITGGTTTGIGVTFYITSTEGIASGKKNDWGVVTIAGNGKAECATSPCASFGGGMPVSQSANPGGPGGGGSGGGGGSVGLVNLSAPTCSSNGSMAGMLFVLDRLAPNLSHRIVGSACSSFEGGLYFLTADLAFRGTSTIDSWQMTVANTMEIMGTSCAVNTYKGKFAGMPPVRKVTLLE